MSIPKVAPGATIELFFETFAGSTGAPVTISGLAVGDIKLYRNGSTTERASTSGYTLLDTDGVDFDGITGIHGVSVDTSDNTTAGFFVAGGRYEAIASAVTVDSQTMSFRLGRFRIGHDGAIVDTTIATLASQTSFTLTAGPTNNSALRGCHVIVSSPTGATVAVGVISAYTGSTKTVTLAFDPAAYTMAAGDNISILPPSLSDVRFVGGTAQTAGDLAALITTVDDLLDTEVAAIKAKTDLIPSDPADASDIAAMLTAIDDYIDTEVAAVKAVTDKVDTMLAADGAAYQFTNGALENAPGGGDGSVAVLYRTPFTLRAEQRWGGDVLRVPVDTVLDLLIYFQDKDGAPLDITGADIGVQAINSETGAVVSTVTASVDYGRGGAALVSMDPDWTATAGRYYLSARVDKGSNVIIPARLPLIVETR